MMPNVLQYPIALFGALRAGPDRGQHQPDVHRRELKHQLEDSGAKAIVVLDNFAATVQQVVAETAGQARRHHRPRRPARRSRRACWSTSSLKHVKKMVPAFHLPQAVRFRDALARGARAPDARRSTLGHDDIAFLQYTGGTTGVAKGAMLTHGNMIANMLQAGGLDRQQRQAGRGSHHHRAAAVPHLLADGELPGLHAASAA